jgi:hypothetical protein
MTDSRQFIYLVACPGVLIFGGIGSSHSIFAPIAWSGLEIESDKTKTIIANLVRDDGFINFYPLITPKIE